MSSEDGSPKRLENSDQVRPALALEFGESSWTGTWAANLQTLPKRKASIRPSLILPRVPGEPYKVDDQHPVHPRGAALSWPPESWVGDHSEAGIVAQGAGRVPLAMALGAIGKDAAPWKWSLDGWEVNIAPEEVVATAAAMLGRRYRAETIGLAIPNTLRQNEQQELIDTGRRLGVSVRLVWRPVAAALHWIRMYRKRHGIKALDTLRGRIFVHAHFGWHQIHVTPLRLAQKEHQGHQWLIPARNRPRNEREEVAGLGWATHESRIDPASPAAQWAELFTRPVQEREAARPQEAESTAEARDVGRTTLTEWLQSSWKVEQAAPEAIADRLRQMAGWCEGPIVGMVATGECALTEVCGRRAVDHLLDEIRCEPDTAIIAAGPAGQEVISSGVATYLRRISRNEPTYLDTLPRLQLLVERQGEYSWVDLLEEGDRYVDGGKPWERPEPIRGFSIGRGDKSVVLAVNHEEFEFVRQLQVPIEHPTSEALAAELVVSATPAEGNAKLMLRWGGTESQKNCAVADWRRMEQTGQTPEKFVDSRPRSYPELMPRISSLGLWPAAERALLSVAKDLKRGEVPDRYRWDRLRKRLLQKDVSAQLRGEVLLDSTPVGSEGVPHDGSRTAADAGSTLWAWAKNTKSSLRTNAIRSLGYLSFQSAEFEHWLVEHLGASMRDAASIPHACGHCLRDPEKIASFATWVYGRLEPGRGGVTNNLKAFSQVLRYRPDATKCIPSSLAARIVERSLNVFEGDLSSQGRSFAFRWSSLVIVFLLRRRMYDSGFLDPSGDLGRRAKAAFTEAIQLHQAGKLRPIGGTIDLPAALQQMINYIDRRGAGVIQMGAGD